MPFYVHNCGLCLKVRGAAWYILNLLTEAKHCKFGGKQNDLSAAWNGCLMCLWWRAFQHSSLKKEFIFMCFNLLYGCIFQTGTVNGAGRMVYVTVGVSSRVGAHFSTSWAQKFNVNSSSPCPHFQQTPKQTQGCSQLQIMSNLELILSGISSLPTPPLPLAHVPPTAPATMLLVLPVVMPSAETAWSSSSKSYTPAKRVLDC